MTHYVFFFSGTNNGLSDEYPTNIALLWRYLDRTIPQVGFHFAGPGDDDRVDTWIGAAADRATGSRPPGKESARACP